MSIGTQPEVTIRRSDQRGHVKIDWLEAWHCFNFGGYQELGNDNFGLLIVFNDDIIQPSTGFGTHSHRNLEIITWPVEGPVYHRDSGGSEGQLGPGMLQQMTAGSGISHSEFNPSTESTSRWIQMWLAPDTPNLTPRYQDVEVAPALAGGELVPLVGRRNPDSLIDHNQRDAVFWAGRLPAGKTAALPQAPFVHLYVTQGSIELSGSGVLRSGEAARLRSASDLSVVAGSEGAEILVWEMHSAI